MQTYRAPLREMRFLLHELLDAGALAALPGHEEATPDVIDAMIEEGARLCENVLLPLNRPADEEGCHYENGAVRTPEGFKEAYRRFVEAGWTGVTVAPAYGGQGLPELVSVAFDEMVCSTNLAFGVYPLLSRGAAALIEAHAADALKDAYLPRLADGSWSGTMCLTEAHCGTDLGQIRTRAVPAGDGAYAITGTKIFISAGEHDLTENIVHLVLARLPDAPSGVRGISLFLVPKRRLNPDGSAGPANGVRCGSIEHKMGIHGSATCVMHFEAAEGYLIGAPHQGLRCMFTMMNGARLGVGLQGLGLGETAYQSAASYARERRQGRALKGAAEPEAAADPIIVHPDVRRMLLTARALNEGARALAYWIALQLDISRHHPDATVREEADELVQLMTPIIKAFFTDYGFEAANLAVQVHGGHGYIRELGMEQLVRDARIGQIYEGANGIQALDLVGRKLPRRAGRFLRHFFHPALAFVGENRDDPALADIVRPVEKALGQLQAATLAVAQRGLGDPEETGAAASDYLKMFGLVAVGFMWCRMAKLACEKRNGDAFYESKLKTARFYVKKILPDTAALYLKIMAGKSTVMAHAAEEF
ncbi:MAG: acyl-CoA dehydrogenase C-terminal domain-containing protein [Defluviicoccus sp.]|nr:acyl-CoA dehydrogenase C-terminal domain-containing protein [Defluviicoccus sp.]MDE0384584.1 acyl-CoA dehydrogenase C-terminal domain-containing protein [Defluviicoccus sp.]